jgi:YcxB-like protein
MNSTRTLTDDDLTIEYALTRREICRSFLQSVAESPKIRRTLLFSSVLVSALTLIPNAVLLRSITLNDATNALKWAVGTLVLFPLGIFIFGKTGKRTFTISPNGISTAIGRLRGQVPWKKVSAVTETAQSVLIVGTSGNAFFIPRRAFSGPEHQGHFVAEIKRWMVPGNLTAK